MRAPRTRLYGAQPPVRALKARLYGTHPNLHDRAGTFASLLYKVEKPFVCPSDLRDNLCGFCLNLHKTLVFETLMDVFSPLES